MKYDHLSKIELASKIEQLERDLAKANSKNKKPEKVGGDLSEQSSLLNFIMKTAIPSADKSSVDEFSKALLHASKDYTGAVLATFSLYKPETKQLVLFHIDVEQDLLRSLLKTAGERLLKTALPIDDDTYKFIIKERVSTYKTFTEVTFGVVPTVIDKAIRSSTGIDRLYGIAHVIEGKLYGTTMLAFKKGQLPPSIELLESFSHLISVSLRRHNAETALKASEENFREMFKNMGNGVCRYKVLDNGNDFIFADINTAGEDITKVKKADILGKSIFDVRPNSLKYGLTNVFKKVWKTGIPETYKDKFYEDNDITGYFTNYVYKLTSGDIVAIFEDQTRRKLAEQKIIASEEKYHNLFNSMQEGVYLHDMVYDQQGNAINYRIIDANVISEKHLAIKREDAIGKLATELYQTKTAPFLEIYAKVAETGEPYIFEEYFEPLNKHFYISVFAPKKGKFATAFLDITTQKIVQQDLIKAKEKAEESDRLKSAFLANMSHEIRTPMNGILGFANLLKEPGLSGEQQEKFIDIIEKSGHRMLNTINDIVDISKIEAGQVDIKISEINLNAEMEELLEFFLPEAKKKNLQLSITSKVPHHQATIRTDKKKVNAILINFIKNAIKYTPSGTIEMGYAIREKNEEKELEFYVKDTGIGIPENRLKAVFDRFVQADIEDRHVYEGSGLGLAICKAYVEMLGGTIWVESEVEEGSHFYFTIPYTNGKVELVP